MNTTKTENLIKYPILLVLAYFTLFGHIERQPVRIFDEARLANNAYEMYKNGNFVVTYYDGKPDMWNTKPPLMIWCQAFFIKSFGVRELSVRLPAAISAFLLCVFLVFFSVRYLKNQWLGFFAVIVLLTSFGYIHVHAARTGDYDSTLTLFTAIYSLLFFQYIESDKPKYLYLSVVGIILATLTKGIAGLLFVPALVIYAFVRNKVLSIAKLKHLYIGILMFIIVIGGYYLFRESQNHGYLKAVWENELGGRYFEVNEGHAANFWYYFSMLRLHHYRYWLLFVPIGFIVGLFSKDKRIGNIAIFSSISIVCYFLIISISKTKLEWYAVPLYPFLALLAAVLIDSVFSLVKNFTSTKQYAFIRLIPFILLIAVFYSPVYKTLKRMIPPREFSWDVETYNIGYFLKDAVKGKYNLTDHVLLHDGYFAHILFYQRVLQENGMNVSLNTDWRNIEGNCTVVAYQAEVKDFLEMNFNYDVVFTRSNIVIYRLTDRRL
ncbi:MAG: ArnT family glycosyltransferase [Bacteroidales bacterium]